MFIKIFLMIILPVLLYSQTEKMRIAILDLQPVEVSKSSAKTVSDVLRTELFNTGYFLVIERGEMESILKEQGFQQTGCTETECAVQMGKLLSVHKILVGTLSKLGNSFIINARIVDVEKGVVEFAEKHVVASEDELIYGCEQFANKLAGRIQESGQLLPEEQLKREQEEKRELEYKKQKELKERKKEEAKKYYRPYKGLSIVSYVFGAGSFIAGVIFDSKAASCFEDRAKYYDEYKKTTSNFDYLRNKIESADSDGKKYLNLRNWTYIAAGAFITTGSVLYLIKKRRPEKVSFYIDLQKQSLILNLKF